MDKHFKQRQQERRIDPMLATLVDVAIAYRENLGSQVAQAFMRETGVPAALAGRVLEGAAGRRSGAPRRRASPAASPPAAQERSEGEPTNP